MTKQTGYTIKDKNNVCETDVQYIQWEMEINSR